MGYRSEVVVRICEKATEVVKLFCKLDPKVKSLIDDAEYGDDTVYQWSWVKWYDHDPDIRAFLHMLEEIGDENYGFIRLGEESDDIEYLGSPYEFDMYVSRKIEW